MTIAHQVTIEVSSPARFALVDVTEAVRAVVRDSKIRTGVVVVTVLHTTAAIRINESEPLLATDFHQFMSGMVRDEQSFAHDDFDRRESVSPDERMNGAAHCRAFLCGASESLSVAAGHPILGQWQRLFLVDFDKPQERSVCVTVLGVP